MLAALRQALGIPESPILLCSDARWGRGGSQVSVGGISRRVGPDGAERRPRGRRGAEPVRDVVADRPSLVALTPLLFGFRDTFPVPHVAVVCTT